MSLGLPCEIGLRTRKYHILSGSVLSVWSKVESVLASVLGGINSKMQIMRLRTDSNERIVGKWENTELFCVKCAKPQINEVLLYIKCDHSILANFPIFRNGIHQRLQVYFSSFVIFILNEYCYKEMFGK